MANSRGVLTNGSRIEFTPSRTVRWALGVAVFAVATALSAKIALPLPGTPVPFTFQPLLVMLAGALLGLIVVWHARGRRVPARVGR